MSEFNNRDFCGKPIWEVDILTKTCYCVSFCVVIVHLALSRKHVSKMPLLTNMFDEQLSNIWKTLICIILHANQKAYQNQISFCLNEIISSYFNTHSKHVDTISNNYCLNRRAKILFQICLEGLHPWLCVMHTHQNSKPCFSLFWLWCIR